MGGSAPCREGGKKGWNLKKGKKIEGQAPQLSPLSSTHTCQGTDSGLCSSSNRADQRLD